MKFSKYAFCNKNGSDSAILFFHVVNVVHSFRCLFCFSFNKMITFDCSIAKMADENVDYDTIYGTLNNFDVEKQIGKGHFSEVRACCMLGIK